MYPGGGVEHLAGSEHPVGVEAPLTVGGGDADPAESEGLEVPHAQTNAIVSMVAVCPMKPRMATTSELTERRRSRG